MSKSKIKVESKRLIGQCVALLLINLAIPVGASHAQIPTGPIPLADVPVFSTTTVRPNVMFTLDNSGSMNWEFAPRYVNSFAGGAEPNENPLYVGRYCLTNYQFNRLYYDPNTIYRPPVKADGSRFPDSSYTSAWRNGFDTTEGTLNLQTSYVTLANYRTAPGVGFFQSGNRGAFYAVYSGPPLSFNPTTCHDNALYTEFNVNLQTAAQKTNFANWYSYYRKRMLSMKTAVGEAFQTVDDKFRVGFHTINTPGGTGTEGRFLAAKEFVGADRIAWYNAFYAQDSINAGTPLRAATWRIGEYYRAARSPATGTTLTGASDPVQFSCQQNYHILSTDGQWNGSAAPNPQGTTNYDNVLPNSPALLEVLGKEFSTTFFPNDPWPKPYREKPTSPATGSLSDLAAYYWMTDLRPLMVNNVPSSSGNLANWQHMVSFGVAFAEQGTIPYPNGIKSILEGTTEWPFPAADSESAIDDLWHSALVGHGQYFSVTSPAELTSALGRALNEIRARSGSAAGAEFSSGDLTVSGAVAYRPGFTAGAWTGDLAAFAVEPSTGVVSTIKEWSAAAKLDAAVAPAGSGGGWEVNRKIATWRTDSNVGVPFRWTNLSATQQATISANATRGEQIVNYLRGDRSNEDGGGVTRLFRQRTSVLGDIVNSEPRLVAKPSAPYTDAFHNGYSAFVASKASRRPTLYVGSNDGMLHAFDATSGGGTSGQELWAFVPGLSYQSGVYGLAGSAWRPSDPIGERFEHRFRVDQTPQIKDINFGETVGGSGVDWRTILVSGMNKGGKGYFALDVTDPEADSEAAVAAKVLWQFTGDVANDPKMGYTYGEPLIIKTRRFGWVVAVTSGYNNVTGGGKGHLWLLNPRTGAVLHRFDTTSGSNALPSGLARINSFMKSARDQITEQIYGTDLLGNLWRFDVSGATAGDWGPTGTSDKVVHVASVGQVLTSAPSISANPFNAAERWVFFGSGRLMAVGDLTATPNHTMFAIKDGGTSEPGVHPAPIAKTDLAPLPLAGSVPSSPTGKGWYAEMLPAGSHVINAPTISRGTVTWSATRPTNDPCSPGATSLTYVRAMGDGQNLVVGGTSIAASANVVKISVLKLVNNSPTSSKGKYKLNFSYGDGTGGPGARDANLDFTLTGGRTGIRFVTTQ